MADSILRLTLMGGMARAFLAETTELCETARAIHGLSRTASAALGRLLTGASILGATLKGEGESLTARINGGGPLGTLLAVARPDASVKGCVDRPEVELPLKGGKLDVGGAVGADGELAIIKDFGVKEPYVGRSKLVSGEIAEDFAAYFATSEQTPSLVSLGVLVGERVLAAGGMIIQPLPGIDEVSLKSIEYGARLYEGISSTIAEYGAEGAVFQLLAHLEPTVLERVEPRYRCDCDRDRMERALIALGEAELIDLIRRREGAELTCHFCRRSETFNEDELSALLFRAKGGGA